MYKESNVSGGDGMRSAAQLFSATDGRGSEKRKKQCSHPFFLGIKVNVLLNYALRIDTGAWVRSVGPETSGDE